MRQNVSLLFRNNANLSLRRTVPGYRVKTGAASHLGPDLIPGGQMVAEGDSLTAGISETDCYPQYVENGLPPIYTLTSNHGTPGARIADCVADAAVIDAMYSASGYPNNFLLWWCGTNDLITADTLASIEAAWIAYVQARIAVGWKLITLTTLPRYELTDGGRDDRRIDFNTYIRQNAAPTGYWYADVAADSRIGDAGDEQGPFYDSGHIHLTAAGYQIVADWVIPVITGLFTS